MNNFFETIYASAPPDGIVEFSVGGVLPKHRTYRTVLGVMQDPDEFEGATQTYFGPCLRQRQSLGAKDNFAGTTVAWIDVDDLRRPAPVLPASAVVSSGHGWHLYWTLDKVYTRIDQVEAATQALAKCLGGDSAWDVARLMRVPGTINAKDDNPKPCVLMSTTSQYAYTLKALYASSFIRGDVRDMILTGKAADFTSRSERDWYIIKHLVDVGLEDDDIRIVFDAHACGDKYRENGDKYLVHTLERARKDPPADTADSGIVERGNSYYKKVRGGVARISTFVMEPKLLLEGDDQDWLMCDVRAQGTQHIWPDFVISKAAFTSLHSLSSEISKASWIWLGTDADVRVLLAYLMTKLQTKGMPYARAVSTLGRHTVEGDDRTFYVAENCVLSSDGDIWTEPTTSPIVYVDSRREVPRIQLSLEDPDTAYVSLLCDSLRILNEPDVIWPMIGWFMATPFKPVFERYNFRFPVLNVSGTRGSGKSTLIQHVFQPLMGYKAARAYNADTTYFVTLTLLGSSYTVPVAFTEFRSAETTDFNRFVLLAYDTGRDPRGHANQTTTDYPLIAPFCVDGEDMLDDPAALERIISVQPDVVTVAEGSQAHQAYLQLELMDLTLLARPFYQYAIATDIKYILDQAEEDIYGTFVEQLPTRIRRNLTLCWTGILLFADFLNKTYDVEFLPAEGPEVLRSVLERVYSTRLGRASTAADDFVEAVVNAAARKLSAFPWSFDTGVLWFQLAPAFEYWVGQKVRQRQSALTQRAIRSQLSEMASEYMLEPSVRVIRSKTVLAYGVNLQKAYEAGLDVPQTFGSVQFVVDL
jgi:hypothetical protein